MIDTFGHESILLPSCPLTVIVFAAIMTTSADMKFAGSFNANKKAFYIAEAGVEEVRILMPLSNAHPKGDNHPTSTS